MLVSAVSMRCTSVTDGLTHTVRQHIPRYEDALQMRCASKQYRKHLRHYNDVSVYLLAGSTSSVANECFESKLLYARHSQSDGRRISNNNNY